MTNTSISQQRVVRVNGQITKVKQAQDNTMIGDHLVTTFFSAWQKKLNQNFKKPLIIAT